MKTLMLPTPPAHIAGRCLHREAGVCPACAAFGQSFKSYVQTVAPGAEPWTRTAGRLNAQAEARR